MAGVDGGSQHWKEGVRAGNSSTDNRERQKKVKKKEKILYTS